MQSSAYKEKMSDISDILLVGNKGLEPLASSM